MSKIILDGLQIKSLEKAKLLADAISLIEVECGIRSTLIEVRDCFLCCDIDMSKLNATPTEELLRNIFAQIELEKSRINKTPWTLPEWVTDEDVQNFKVRRKAPNARRT